jgi:hypothetical protein
MMWIRIGSILGAFVAVIAFQATAVGGVIFDNSVSGNQGITTSSNPQIGNEVTPAGSLRAVTELDIGVTSQGAPSTANIQVFIYANDGAGGAPGTLLWKSAVQSGVSLNTFNTLISFSVPSVVVPDTFTYSASIAKVTGSVAVGFVPSTGGPSTGTFDQAWVGDTGSFSAVPGAYQIEARVIAGAAVPEPSTFALLAVGLAGALVPVCRRVRRRQMKG